MKLSLNIVQKTKNSAPSSLLRQARIFCEAAFLQIPENPEFRFLAGKEVGLALVLVSPRESQKLNQSFRKKNRPANVLSFPLYKNLAELRGAEARVVELGDIVIAPAIIAKEAAATGRSFYAQFCWALAHGILHILGFDHERTRKERQRMEELESDLLLNLL